MDTNRSGTTTPSAYTCSWCGKTTYPASVATPRCGYCPGPAPVRQEERAQDEADQIAALLTPVQQVTYPRPLVRPPGRHRGRRRWFPHRGDDL